MIDDIGLMELPPCSGTPSSAGIAKVSPTMICSSPGSATLSVTATPAVSGLTFQWYEASSLAGPYSAIAGATTNPYSRTGISSSKYYFCQVGCSSGGSTVNTDTVNLKIAPLNPPYVEDFETGAMGVNMPCASYTYSWDMYSYWYLYDGPHPYSWISLGNHTPGGAKWLFAGAGLGYSTDAEYWFTPAINFTAGKAYNLSYWYITDGYDNYNFGARVGTSQSASAMTKVIGADVTSSTTSYTKFSGDFVCGSTGPQYIGIRFKANNWYYGSGIDDIGLDQLPSCSAKPSAGSAKATPSRICTIGATTLSLVGLTAASDLTYQWQTSTTGTAGSFTDIAGATAPDYTTGTITTGPVYFRCVVKCPLITAPNTDTSTAIMVEVGPITPPYIETFESATAGVNQPCASYTYAWESGTGTTNFNYWGLKDSPSPYYSGMVNHTTGGSKYLSAGYYIGTYALGSSGNQQYWFSPPLQLTGDMAYKCNYWYSGGETYVSVNYGLYYGTSQTASAMTPMCPDITGENNTSYKEIVGVFTAPSTGVYYLGVKVNHTKYGGYGAAIDDIGVVQLPLCAAVPTAGVASAKPTLICSSGTSVLTLTGYSMASKLSFQWQDSTATGWNNVIGGTGATTTSYTTPVLTAMRKYRCIVTCPLIGAPNSDTTDVVVVNVGPITPPYIETFESGTEGVNMPCASYTYSWGPGYLWYIYGSPYDSYYSAIVNHTPGGSKYLFAGYYLGYYASGAQYWFSPAIKFTSGDTYEFSYWYNGSGYSGGSTTLGMYYGASQSAGSMIPVRSDITGVNTSSYKQLIGRFVAPSTGNYFLGVKVQHSTFTYPGVVIDDIGLMQLPPCTGAPTVGAVSAAPSMLCSAGGTVKLDMDMAGVSKASGLSYRWEYTTTKPASPASFTATGSSAALTSSLYTSPSLSSTTWFRCIVKCTLTGDSTISDIIKVDVGAIEPPYIETFESGTPGVNMPCAGYTYSFGAYYYWNINGSPMTYGTVPLDNHTPSGSKFLIGGYYLHYYSGSPEYWFSPAIKFTAGKLYQLSYWHQSDNYSGATYTLETFMGTAQTKAAMTTPIGSAVTPTGSYKEFKTRFTAATTGNFYLGFKKSQTGFGYGIAIDDIGLNEVPPCNTLSSISAGTIYGDPKHICVAGGTTVLDLTGSTLATGLTYDWYSSTSASGPYTATGGTGIPYTTDPLFVKTWFKVVVTCTATGMNDTSAPFVIGVGGMDLPYKEDFETTVPGTAPLCSDATLWGSYYYNGWLVYGATITGNYKNHTPGGKNFLVGGYYLGSPSSPSEDNYWFTPGLNIKGGYKYDLSFYYLCKGSGAPSGNKLGVYFGRSQSVGGMTTNLIPYREFTNTSYEQYDTSFVMPSTGVYYFGFRKSGANPSSDYSYYGLGLDDINLNYSACDNKPFAGYITSSKPSGTQYCLGTEITLKNIGATISLVPGIQYQWQRRSISLPMGWMPVVGATDTIITSDTLVGYEYRLAVICTNTNDTALSTPFLVPEYPPHPPVTISPSTSPIVYCLGDSVKFNATNYTGAVYDWMIDSVIIPGWKFSDMGATDPGTYMVKVTSAMSPCPAYSNQVKLIADDPGYSVSITKPVDSIICAGSSITLSAIASKPGVTFQWRKNNVDIPGATFANYVVTSTGYYRVMVYDGLSTCKAASRTVLITVKPNPPAIIYVPGGTTTACENNGVLLNANIGGYKYEWLRNGSTIFGWVDSSVIIKNSGIYRVKVRTADGCVSVSAPITVNILPAPTPTIVKSGLLLSATSTYVSYKWYRNGTELVGTGSTYTVAKHGVYRLVVKDANGCEGESNPIEFTENEYPQLGIVSNATQKDEIRIYPNPSDGIVFIESPIGLDIEVKDATGKTIFNNKNVKEVDLSKYADGTYLFIISNKETVIKQQRVTKVSH